MTFRYRKSIQIIPGLRMNISPRGVGYSVGRRGLRVTLGASGRVNRTIGIPGTGLRDVTTIRPAARSAGRSPARTDARGALPRALLPTPPHPRLFAPGWEKHLFRALADADGTTPGATTAVTFNTALAAVARRFGVEHPDVRVLAAALDGLHHFGFPEPAAQDRARNLIGWAITRGVDLKTHPFVERYLADRTWPVEIAVGIVAHLSIAHDVLLLAEAELHQAAGDLPAAIWTVEQAVATAPAALSLVELYAQANRHQEVIDLTNEVANLDDSSALLLTLRARSFAALGYYDAARQALNDALRLRAGRSPEVRHRALLERAALNLKTNRKAAARKDLETVLAEDSHYPGLTEMMATLPSPKG